MKNLLLTFIILFSISCAKDRLQEHKDKLKKDLINFQDQFYNLNNEIISINDTISRVLSSRSPEMDEKFIKNLEFCKNELYNILKGIEEDLLTSYKKGKEKTSKRFGLSGSIVILTSNQRSIPNIQEIMNEIVENCCLKKNIQILKLKEDAESLYYILAYASYNKSKSTTSIDKDSRRGKIEIFFKNRNKLEKLLKNLEDYISKESANSKELNNEEFNDIKKVNEKLRKSLEESEKYTDIFKNNKDIEGSDIVANLEKINIQVLKDLERLYNTLITLPLPKMFNENIYVDILTELGRFLKKDAAVFIKDLHMLSNILMNNSVVNSSEYSQIRPAFDNIFEKNSNFFEYLTGKRDINELKNKFDELFKEKNFKKKFKIFKKGLLDIDDIEKKLYNKHILHRLKIQMKRLKKT